MMNDSAGDGRSLAANAMTRCSAPRGSFYAFPDISGCLGGRFASPTDLAERLLDEEAVALVAGEAFGSDRHVRISFACSREALREGFARMKRFLARS